MVNIILVLIVISVVAFASQAPETQPTQSLDTSTQSSGAGNGGAFTPPPNPAPFIEADTFDMCTTAEETLASFGRNETRWHGLAYCFANGGEWTCDDDEISCMGSTMPVALCASPAANIVRDECNLHGATFDCSAGNVRCVE